MTAFALLGAGVIGTIHASNMASHPDYELLHVIDPEIERARKLCVQFGGAPGVDQNQALEDRQVDAVVIASSTSAHAKQVKACAKAGKTFLCEKPIADNLQEAIACTITVEETNTVALMGFNRRLDRDYRLLFDRVHENRIGKVEMIRIVSRSFKAPAPETVPFSGGMIREKGTHFFDLTSWISGLEPREVYSAGACLIDKGFTAYGEVDTASLIVRLENDALVSLEFSRRAVYGQDEWIEINGSEGMLQCGRPKKGSTIQYTKSGVLTDGIHSEWYEQFKPTYAKELELLASASLNQEVNHATLREGLRAQAVAEAALQSMTENRPIEIKKIW